MIESLMQEWVTFVEGVAGDNQMISGAISLWFLGTLTFLCRNIPSKLFQFCKRHFTTSMTLNNGGGEQEYLVGNFIKWLQPKMNEKMSRTLEVYPNGKVGIGYGIHFFFHQHRLFWITKTQLESSGSERQKFEISLGTFGRSHNVFHNIVEEMKPKPDKTKLWINDLDAVGDWSGTARVPKRNLNTVAMDSELKSQIVEQITHFKENRDWFINRGIPHKLAYALHGKPGGGKTSLVKAIASEFDMEICRININNVSDVSLERGLASKLSRDNIILIEDIDSSPAVHARGGTAYNSTSADGMSGMEDSSSRIQLLTLSGILNVLDGVCPLDNCILFMTTNHLEKLDPALYRKGRVDYLFEINETQPDDIHDYLNVIYPNYDFSGIEFKPMMGCHLNEALLVAREDPDEYVRFLVEKGYARYRSDPKQIVAA